jgi:hypothetical protein
MVHHVRSGSMSEIALWNTKIRFVELIGGESNFRIRKNEKEDFGFLIFSKMVGEAQAAQQHRFAKLRAKVVFALTNNLLPQQQSVNPPPRQPSPVTRRHPPPTSHHAPSIIHHPPSIIHHSQQPKSIMDYDFPHLICILINFCRAKFSLAGLSLNNQ